MKRILYFICSFSLTAAAQPDFGLVPCIVTAACGYALFWSSIHTLSIKKKLFLSLLWMTGVQLIHTNWMMSTQYVGGGILLGWLLHTLSVGGIFAFISLWVDKANTLLKQLALCGMWVLLEWARPWLFFGIGFAWNPLGLPLTAHLYSLQTASIAGVLGLSFWILWTNLLFFYKKRLVLVVACFPYILGGGLYFFHYQQEKASPTLNALLVQLATQPWQSEQDIWEGFFRVLAPHVHQTYDLVVLPEGALPHAAQTLYIPTTYLESMAQHYWGINKKFEDRPYMNNLSAGKLLAECCQGSVVIGMTDQQEKQHYNAAFHFHSPTEVETYHKRKLLAFGEYLPFCFSWARALLPLPPDFASGHSSLVFSNPVAPFAISICYEETLGDLNRYARHQGACLLLGLTNDMWYPHSRLPISHLHHARVRTVELGVPLLRACNTGVTCAIASTGKILDHLPYENKKTPASEGALSVQIPLHYYKTPYLIWGDKMILSVSVIFLTLSCCRKRNRSLQSRTFV